MTLRRPVRANRPESSDDLLSSDGPSPDLLGSAGDATTVFESRLWPLAKGRSWTW
jgi:hypothetical protein